MKSKERSDWKYDKIEYSIVKSEDDRSRWEDFYISEFYSKYGELPRYNKVKGDYSNEDEDN